MFQNRKEDIIAVGAGILIVLLLWAASALQDYSLKKSGKESFKKEYSLTLTDMDGKPVHLSDYAGKLVVAYMWASWCPYCGAEIENLAKLKQTYGDSIAIIAVNRAEPAADAKSYIARLTGVDGIQFLLDPSDSFFKSIGGYAMPETVFIKSDGTVLFHQRGPMQIDEVNAKLKQLTA